MPSSLVTAGGCQKIMSESFHNVWKTQHYADFIGDSSSLQPKVPVTIYVLKYCYIYKRVYLTQRV